MSLRPTSRRHRVKLKARKDSEPTPAHKLQKPVPVDSVKLHTLRPITIKLVALPAHHPTHAPHRSHKRRRVNNERVLLVAQRRNMMKLQSRIFILTPVILFSLLALVLVPEAWMRSELRERVTAVTQLWQLHPVLAVQAVQAGLPERSWTADRAPDSVERFEQEILGVSPVESGFAIDVRDAVREVMLARSSLQPSSAIAVADTLVQEAQSAGYDPFLVLAIIEVESNFDPKAVSYRGARGLMQLMPDTRAWMLQRDATLPTHLDPEHDIRIGVRYFALLHKGFGGRLERALQAYNCGPGKLVEVLRETAPMPEETRCYADRVMKRYTKFKRDYAYLKHA